MFFHKFGRKRHERDELQLERIVPKESFKADCKHVCVRETGRNKIKKG